ncbi:hypothetical protein pipiens_011667 [Culex pipiens pipiens]|uniref:C2H2-type domain-containing protein n=1 Tax=Culex pipiens pipiens TaxID=38569 RepID=A0ABD1D5G0_CULPP
MGVRRFNVTIRKKQRKILNRSPNFLEDPEEPEEFLQDEHEESLESYEQPQKISSPKHERCSGLTASTEPRPRKCSKSHVDRHENPDDRNPWKCTFANCDEVYPTKDELLRHKKEMHSKYVCDICGLVLKHKYTLEVHLRRHKGESKYPCQYCRTAYFTSNELKLHMSVVHLSLVDFQCNDCGLAFKNSSSIMGGKSKAYRDRQKMLYQQQLAREAPLIKVLEESHNFTPKEIKRVKTRCPELVKLADCPAPIPVRFSLPNYPHEWKWMDSQLAKVRDYVNDCGEQQLGKRPLDVFLIAGYVMVLAENDDYAAFVRGLFPGLKEIGMDGKEPTMKDVEDFYGAYRFLPQKNPPYVPHKARKLRQLQQKQLQQQASALKNEG